MNSWSAVARKKTLKINMHVCLCDCAKKLKWLQQCKQKSRLRSSVAQNSSLAYTDLFAFRDSLLGHKCLCAFVPWSPAALSDSSNPEWAPSLSLEYQGRSGDADSARYKRRKAPIRTEKNLSTHNKLKRIQNNYSHKISSWCLFRYSKPRSGQCDTLTAQASNLREETTTAGTS